MSTPATPALKYLLAACALLVPAAAVAQAFPAKPVRVVGSEFVMRAPADGYTVLVTTSSTLVTSLFLSKNVPFDPVKELIVPTLAETLPDFRRIRGWIALFGPAGTPQPVVARLNAEMRNAMRSPEAKATLDRNDTIDISGPPAELAGFIRADMELSAALAKAIGIKPE